MEAAWRGRMEAAWRINRIQDVEQVGRTRTVRMVTASQIVMSNSYETDSVQTKVICYSTYVRIINVRLCCLRGFAWCKRNARAELRRGAQKCAKKRIEARGSVEMRREAQRGAEERREVRKDAQRSA